MSDSFNEKLRWGMRGEKVVSQWLAKNGYYVTPTSLIVPLEGRAPCLVREDGGRRAVLPDILAHICGSSRWIEVKTKTKDVFHNISREHRQGIKATHFDDYLFVERTSGIPGYLAFLVLQPAPIKLRMAPLRVLYQNKRMGVMDAAVHCFFPIDIFDTHQVLDDDLQMLCPAPHTPTVNYPWEKTAPATNVQQEYFDFGAGEERRRVI